jgi:hypothetical protein
MKLRLKHFLESSPYDPRRNFKYSRIPGILTCIILLLFIGTFRISDSRPEDERFQFVEILKFQEYTLERS